MLSEDVSYESSFLTDVIHRDDTTCAYVEDLLPEDVHVGWLFQVEMICPIHEPINFSGSYDDLEDLLPVDGYLSFLSEVENSCSLNKFINFDDIYSKEGLDCDLELTHSEGDPYSLEDAVKFHEETSNIREGIKNSFDVAANILSVGYYGFIIYTCPLTGVSLGALKILKSYGAFDSVCNDDYSFMGYTACDAIEDTLATHALFSAGGKLAKVIFDVNPTTMQKISLSSAEKIMRKTVFSYSQMKSPGLTKATDYAPNAAYVITSESAKMLTATTLPYPIDVLICKSLGQVSRQLTKDWIKDKDSESYLGPVQKGVVSSACKVFSDLTPNSVQPHLYKHCKEAGRRIGGYVEKHLSQRNT